MRESQPPCTRCKKRGLPCTVNKSLQMILESDSVWKNQVNRKIRNLESAIEKLAGNASMPDLLDAEDDEEEDDPSEPQDALPTSNLSPQIDKHKPHNFEIIMDDHGPAAIPGSIVSPVIMPGVEPNRAEDIITKGVLTVEQAQTYLAAYQDRLDHFLYRIIGDRRELHQIRAGSPLLLAAICAVGALHVASSDFEKCYQVFVSTAAAQTFSRRNTMDDVRGLCVGAFWLSSISWTCIGIAVRISTEIGLHRSITKALEGDRNHYFRTRLYYLVWV